LDVGSCTTKVGFGGEGNPRGAVPSAVGVIAREEATRVTADEMDLDFKNYAFNSALSSSSSSSSHKRRSYFAGEDAMYRRDDMEIVNPLENGLVKDWNVIERVFDQCFKKYLFVDPAEHPVMLADRPFDTRDRREALLELLFEKFESPALYLAHSPVLAAFACGKSTALVVDSGGSLTTCVPVHDGYVLHKASRKSHVAGDVMDLIVDKLLFQSGHLEDTSKPILKPRYKVQRELISQGVIKCTELDFPRTTASFHRYAYFDVIRDIKEVVFRVSESQFDPSAFATIPSLQYELPDGQMLDVRAERFAAVENLFNPTSLLLPNDEAEFGYKFEGLHKMIMSSVDACDVDIRRDLFATICLTGGNSLFVGLPERLQKELNIIAPPALKAKINLPYTKLERRFGVWLGGSILSSLGTFHQMWLSKQEYQEHGPTLLAKKCP